MIWGTFYKRKWALVTNSYMVWSMVAWVWVEEEAAAEATASSGRAGSADRPSSVETTARRDAAYAAFVGLGSRMAVCTELASRLARDEREREVR